MLNLTELGAAERGLLLTVLVVIVAVLAYAAEARLHTWWAGAHTGLDCPVCHAHQAHRPQRGDTVACTTCGTVRLLPRHRGGAR